MRNSPAALPLVIAIVLAGTALWFAPPEAVRPARALVRDALRPGQMLMRAGCSRAREALRGALSSQTASRAHMLERALDDARLENRRLALQVAVLRGQLDDLSTQERLPAVSAEVRPLITGELITARVLGEETAALWRARLLVGAGAADRIVESALVLDDSRPLVDLGTDADLSSGDAVYSGRIVVGKIAEVGRFSSTLRLVTDPGYSGRARLARNTSRGLVFGVEGTLVGDGSVLCRLKHISEPVNVGDEVFTGGNDGALPGRMYYGQVVRAELPPGAREWSVWVQPAAAKMSLETVAILRRTLNRDRMLAN